MPVLDTGRWVYRRLYGTADQEQKPAIGEPRVGGTTHFLVVGDLAKAGSVGAHQVDLEPVMNNSRKNDLLPIGRPHGVGRSQFWFCETLAVGAVGIHSEDGALAMV
jgi:hypothetical protein